MRAFPENIFLKNIDSQYHERFGASGAKIGTVLRIRFPADYVVTDGPSLSVLPTKAVAPVQQLSASEVVAVGAAAVLAKNPVISRRFWTRS